MEEQPLPNGNKRLVFINRNIVTPLWTFFDWMRDLLIEANDESDLDCSRIRKFFNVFFGPLLVRICGINGWSTFQKIPM